MSAAYLDGLNPEQRAAVEHEVRFNPKGLLGLFERKRRSPRTSG